ncbi:hypothetical protein SAMD00019534_040360 [Acytostelium subglobosum LB1]|uniref:hypothetical protein n=1 Tax=Acytostelium subglobosum LB1 TaxID=1410327 RepID=UPI0006451FEF|nr:hypothetical protein SAMD00019534_040360 [Acytostelium subglobosum LB1]GAM20861.1 hypothetical protein SAMD00019534_040360 [Acytostelium subglobosum LB1]|eukprot:XP_012755995.1 hypothetical protein SAMD00019534_040360 [Acytostelium subglobosum LB1]
MDAAAEKELEKHVLKQQAWDTLPSHAKAILENSPTKWKHFIIKFSIKHQLRWKTNIIRDYVQDERIYYQEIIRLSITNLVLYPYHIADKLVGMLNVTAFKYYSIMMSEIMANAKSYDELPNFTAVDCLRVLGIGRNQYINLMNKYRSKGFLFKKKKDVIKSLLPSNSVEKALDYWWMLNRGCNSADDERSCTAEELAILEELESSPKQAGIFDRDAALSLLTRGLIFVDIPISDTDTIAVPPLEGFVMNRVSGDYFESLLYKIFVSIDERTTVQTLAELLQIDVELVKQAASLYCRLGFAKKKNLEPLINSPTNPSLAAIQTTGDQSTASTTTDSSSTDSTAVIRIGLIFDSSITAFLMMGNLGYGLKNHAVTMFEVGKLSNEALDDFLGELDKIDTTEFVELEAKRYAASAIALRDTIKFLRYNEKIPSTQHGLDLLSCERMNSLEEATRIRVLSKNYSVLISMSPFATDSCPVISCAPPHFGPAIYEIHSLWFKLYLYNIVGAGPNSVLLAKGHRLKKIPAVFRECEKVRVCSLDHESINVNLSQLLPTVNETLLSSPVLVQAFSYVRFDNSGNNRSRSTHGEHQTIREQQTVIDVPFPLDPIDDSAVPPSTESEYTADNMHLHPLVRRIESLLNLSHSIGYISMLRKDVQIPDENTIQTTWIPYNVYFGVPIFDGTLNRQVCDKIERYNLLNEENTDAHNSASRMLSLNILRFISSTCPPVHPDLDIIDQTRINTTLPSTQNIPLPTQNLSFVNGVLDL